VEQYRSGFLAMVKDVHSVGILAAARQDDSLQPLREAGPFREDVGESLNVSLGNNMPEAFPRRFAVKNASLVPGWAVSILALDTPVFDLRGGPPIEVAAHRRAVGQLAGGKSWRNGARASANHPLAVG
jgi:hypothetical protein